MMRFRLITYSLCQRKVKPLCRSVKGNSYIVVFVNRFSGRGLQFSERNNLTVVTCCVKILLLLSMTWKIKQVKINVMRKKYSLLPSLSVFQGQNLEYYEGWNFNSGNYLFTTDTSFEVLLSFSVVTSIVYNSLPAMWKS